MDPRWPVQVWPSHSGKYCSWAWPCQCMWKENGNWGFQVVSFPLAMQSCLAVISSFQSIVRQHAQQKLLRTVSWLPWHTAPHTAGPLSGHMKDAAWQINALFIWRMYNAYTYALNCFCYSKTYWIIFLYFILTNDLIPLNLAAPEKIPLSCS